MPGIMGIIGNLVMAKQGFGSQLFRIAYSKRVPAATW